MGEFLLKHRSSKAHINQKNAHISITKIGIKITVSTTSTVGVGFIKLSQIIYIMRQTLFGIQSKALMSLDPRLIFLFLVFVQTL